MTDPMQGEHAELLQFLYACPVGLAEMGPEGEILMINPIAMQFLLAMARSPVIVNLFDVMEAYAPELRNMVDAFAGNEGTICEGHRIAIRPLSGERLFEARVLTCTLVKLSKSRYIITLSDVSKQVEEECRLKQAETWFASLLDGVNDFAVLSLDEEGRIDRTNATLLRQTGFKEDEVVGKTLALFEPSAPGAGALTAAEQIAAACRDGWYLTEGEHRRAGGETYWGQRLIAVRHVTEDVEGCAVAGYTVVLRDVTRQDSDAGKLTRMLRMDHLTGAYNRFHFFEAAERECKRATRYNHSLSLICLDIDHFKQVNDTFGHAAGDEVLRVVSARCMEALRPSDLFARLGGEEFVALLPSTNLEGAVHFAERLRRVIGLGGVDFGGKILTVSASFGCAEYVPATDTLSDLLSAADKALYRAKAAGRNRVVESRRATSVGMPA